MFLCKNCNIKEAISLGKYSKNNFCSTKCSHSFATKNDDKNEIKIVPCKQCKILLEINKRASNNILCINCKTKIIKEKKLKKCKLCNEFICLDKEICKRKGVINTLIKYFGFDKKFLGTDNFYKEYFRIKEIFELEYYKNKKSSIDIAKEFNYPKLNSFNSDILKRIIKTRTLSESMNNRIQQKGITEPKGYFYKYCYHTSWENKKCFLRSSYELDYAKFLDNNKINYEVENLRIKYFDTQKNKIRFAIPDFYLPNTNTIVEIKGSFTYDIKNMKDRVKEYKNLGYNFKLILNKKEMPL